MSDELQKEQDRVLVELATERLLRTFSAAVQEQGQRRGRPRFSH
ncbi:hypothetical protein ABT040_18395 [Streptomyces sp. NPDC002688]